MKYRVDEALCCGHGQCHAVAPDVFDLDDDGFNTAAGRTADVDPALEGAAREGADGCPEQAIQLFAGADPESETP
ncbi:MAG TPA: ferredoxin [Pseudonocardia sp.]